MWAFKVLSVFSVGHATAAARTVDVVKAAAVGWVVVGVTVVYHTQRGGMTVYCATIWAFVWVESIILYDCIWTTVVWNRPAFIGDHIVYKRIVIDIGGAGGTVDPAAISRLIVLKNINLKKKC